MCQESEFLREAVLDRDLRLFWWLDTFNMGKLSTLSTLSTPITHSTLSKLSTHCTLSTHSTPNTPSTLSRHSTLYTHSTHRTLCTLGTLVTLSALSTLSTLCKFVNLKHLLQSILSDIFCAGFRLSFNFMDQLSVPSWRDWDLDISFCRLGARLA